MASTKLNDDFREYPYWWEGTDLLGPASGEPQALPQRTDVVVVGAGLTGLAAAHELARAGRSVLVLDATVPGSAASSRNGAMLGRYFKHSFGNLMETGGLSVAVDYFTELRTVYDEAVNWIAEHKLDCRYRECGRIVGAISEKHREKLFREWELRARNLSEEVEFISDPSSSEFATQRYVAGVHILKNASVHPGLYSQSVRQLAEKAGATVIGNTPVLHIEKRNRDFVVSTDRGTVLAKDVLVSTNGYTRSALGWFYKRLSPIKAFMVATDILPDNVLANLRLHDRTYHDNRKNSNYYILSKDPHSAGTRLVFGGRTGLYHASLRRMAEKLHDEMVYFFPEMKDVRLAYGWLGCCSATADMFPHIGRRGDGLHFALGYCFSGLAMAPYLGRKAANLVLGREEEARTLFRQDQLKPVIWPARQRWLIPVAMQYFRMQEPLPK